MLPTRPFGSSPATPSHRLAILVARLLTVVLMTVCARQANPLRAAERASPSDPVAVDFVRDIRPILSDRCYPCHGPDGESREADLRLDQRQSALSVLSPEEPSESEVLRRIFSDDPDEQMPPPSSSLKITLSQAERELLRQWIQQGAPYANHWSFQPLRPVTVPEQDDQGWSTNAIDRFILRRLLQAGMVPSARADKRTLIRRVCLDLTGLPPTEEQISRFLRDQSPSAYENLVDRLLASPAYGERMTAHWLDVARYSDSYGYQVDRDRFVWPWRDWVIRAFNDNMPYDRFITEQLAGDLLPPAADPEQTEQQILATTFNRLHPQKVEGGSTPEEFRVEYVSDRTQTFATSMLGLTFECARCHDHKYDPLTQREYYQLSAFFNNIDEAGLYSYFTSSVPTPTLLLTDAPLRQALSQARRAIERARSELTSVTESAAAASSFQQWLSDRPTLPDPLAGQVAHLDFETDIAPPNKRVDGVHGKAVELTGDDGIGLPVGNFSRDVPFSVSLWMQTPDRKERAVVFHRSRAWTDAGSRGYQLLIEQGQLSASLIHFWPGNAMRVRTRREIPVGPWIHVTMTYDGSSRAEGLRLYINGNLAETTVVRDHLIKNITGGGGDNITIGERFRDRGFTGGRVDDFRVFQRELTPIEVRQLHDNQSLAKLLAKPQEELTTADKEALFSYFLATAFPPYAQAVEALRVARKSHNDRIDQVQEIMVMRELDQRRPTFVLRRGAYDAPTDPVDPDTPAVLPPFPADQPRNRLGLARWLTQPDHPLTARVAVNRFWQLLMGRGLVGTPEDFGSQGAMPTHPELLDWLAHDFVSHGWNIKRLLKQIVMSSTYRQRSDVTDQLLAQDPQNRLLGRAPSYRLDAEMLRDQALHVSGLLQSQLGGPPARPYELATSFKPSTPDTGAGLYRRSVYTYWKRTAPAPVMMTLDAAKRDVCTVRRERTATPLQALVLLNDPQMVEASRVLAENYLKGAVDPTENSSAKVTTRTLAELYASIVGRPPSDDQMPVLERLWQEQHDLFARNAQQAEQFVAQGSGKSPCDPSLAPVDVAALAAVANTLMNFDRTVMKR